MLWYVKSRKDLLFLDAADRVPARTAVTLGHTGVAAIGVEVVGIVVVRYGRPIEAA